jgi:DNA-binding LacI/PurR family transcriptional regulator
VRLARGGTRRVALVVPHIDRWFFGAIVGGIEDVLAKADVDLLLYHVGGPEDRKNFFTQLPARRKVDAVVVVAFPVDDAERDRLALMGVSIFAAGGQSAEYPYVCIDDYRAGRQAVDHLTALGHRRIAMIAAHDPDQPGWPERSGRSEAYVDALADVGVTVRDDLVRDVDWGGLNTAAAMEAILDGGEPPTAVYAHSDELALGVMRTLHRRGLRVPEDVSVIGIDDHPSPNSPTSPPCGNSCVNRARSPPGWSSRNSTAPMTRRPSGRNRPHHARGPRNHQRATLTPLLLRHHFVRVIPAFMGVFWRHCRRLGAGTVRRSARCPD